MSKQETKNVQSTKKNFVYLSAKDVSFEKTEVDATHDYAVWVRALLQNWRQGTVGCKNRSDVSLSTKKPWKQKGTGRARAGSARSPLWRGGGVIFGPQERVKSLKLNKKSKAGVVKVLLSQLFDNKRILLLDWEVSSDKVSTKESFGALSQAGLKDKKIHLFINREDVTNWMAFRNIKNVEIVSFDDVNAYNLSRSEFLVVLKKDINEFKDMVSKWN